VEVGKDPIPVGGRKGEAEQPPSAGDGHVHHSQRLGDLGVGDRPGQPRRQGGCGGRRGRHEQQDRLGLIPLDLVDGAQPGPGTGRGCRR
jgi:hypothetical protein